VGLHIRYVSPLIMVNTYPDAWQEVYTSKLYGLRDPTLAWGLSHTGTRRWSEIGLPDPFGILPEAAGYGLVYGMIASIGPMSSRTITVRAGPTGSSPTTKWNTSTGSCSACTTCRNLRRACPGRRPKR
jgi:hypothetical protein